MSSPGLPQTSLASMLDATTLGLYVIGMPAAETVRLEKVELSFLGLAKTAWVVNRAQQIAAWELYVEVVTRIAVVPLREGEGLLREALSSLHALFPETRRILKSHGASVAIAERGELSLGALAVDVLNVELRPLLSKWHPLLLDHEHTRDPATPQAEHERTWAEYSNLRTRLGVVQEHMTQYADLLARVCQIEPLHRLKMDPKQ